MTIFTAEHFDTICGTAPVRAQIEQIETSRRGAVKKFWLILAAGIVLSIVAGLFLGSIDTTIGLVAFIGLLVASFIFAMQPLNKAAAALKQPVLETIAEQGSLTYVPAGFEPPIFAAASKALFGGWLSTTTFTDLITGADAEGRNFAVYEATLERGHGKNRQQVFSGQIYAFERRGSAQGTTVIVPDRGMFNFFKPERGMERVKFEDDADFEKRFEVYSDTPHVARLLLSAPDFRSRLLDYRGKGRLFAYVGPGEALVAITGKDRFEPGSMFKSIAGEQRVRAIFDEVCESLQLIASLKERLG